MRIQYFQHVEFEGLGMIAEWANNHGHVLQQTAFYKDNAALPALSDYDALIIMGGPMGVYDEAEYKWLSAEKDHIRAAIDAGKPVLGICLGAQLIAASLGAKVAPHTHKEIGWFPIAITDQATGHPIISGLNQAFNVFHWHGDRFEIPQNALHLMCSQACDNQAFLYGKNVLGLQFHLEMDEAAINSIITACSHELTPIPTVQSAEVIKEKTARHSTKRDLFKLLDNWI